MDVSQLKDAVSHIKASDDYKKKIIENMKDRAARSEAEAGYAGAALPEVMIPEKKAFRWSARSMAFAASLAAVLIVAAAGIFFLTRTPLSNPSAKMTVTAGQENTENQNSERMMAAAETSSAAAPYTADASPDTAADSQEPLLGMMMESGDAAAVETAAGCAPSYFDNMNQSLLEIDGSAYYVTGDGRLFQYNKQGTDEELMTLPSGIVLTDGKDLYYSQSGQIRQVSVDGSSSKVILDLDHDITLDYIDQDRLIFHDTNLENLQYHYTVLDRLSGESRPVFENAAAFAPPGEAVTADDGTPAVFLSLLSVSGETAVFDVSGYSWNKVYTVNLSTLKAVKIYDGLILCAAAIGDTVYFAPDLTTDDSSYTEAPQLMSVKAGSTNLTQVDLSSVSFETISWIAKSGSDLLLATYNPDGNGGCVYLYSPLSGQITQLEDKLGNILNFMATDHYFTLFSQDPSAAGGDLTITKEILR